MKISRRFTAIAGAALAGAVAIGLGFAYTQNASAEEQPRTAAKSIQAADPSVIRVGATYISVQSLNGGISVRQASSTQNLAGAAPQQVWFDANRLGGIWAPEIFFDGGRYYIYFSAGGANAHRMYVISSASPATGYSRETQLRLPGDKWAIDGTMFTFENQRYFVWSGWAGDTNGEQNLYIAKMSSPTAAYGERRIISQPREAWERVVGNPFINEGPEAIKDPNGQLHIAYSANGSWSEQYCLADLRLRKGGDPMYVWDWYKSNGCLFGSNRATMMAGWDPTLQVNGPGHHSFVLLNGDINTSPPAGAKFPLMFHAVAKGTPYNWGNRSWYAGSFMWWGNVTYTRANVPGANKDTGFSIKYFE